MIVLKQTADVGVYDDLGRAIDTQRQNNSEETQNKVWRTLNDCGYARQYLLLGIYNILVWRF